MARRRFDQKNNRVDYGELLIEDPDYELDQAVGMTYSLDMEALMGIPLCLGMRGEMTSGQRNNPLYVRVPTIFIPSSGYCNIIMQMMEEY